MTAGVVTPPNTQRVKTSAIQSPVDDVSNHTTILKQLKEGLEIAQRSRGNIGDSYVRVSELIALGLAQIVGGNLVLANGVAGGTSGTVVAGNASAGGVNGNVVLLSDNQEVQFNSSSATGPTLTWGTGAPSNPQPTGSIYLRTDAPSASTLLYVFQGGSWTPVTVP